MDLKEFEIDTEDIISLLLTVAAYVISPILFIWSVNTLFGCGIPFGFKTWLAGFVLIMLLRFHIKSSGSSGETYFLEDDDEDESVEDDERASDEVRQDTKGKLIPYQEHKNRKKNLTDGK